MWILTSTKYIQSKHIRHIHKYHLREREHASILYNSIRVIIYYIASMWLLNAIQKQTQCKKRGLEE